MGRIALVIVVAALALAAGVFLLNQQELNKRQTVVNNLLQGNQVNSPDGQYGYTQNGEYQVEMPDRNQPLVPGGPSDDVSTPPEPIVFENNKVEIPINIQHKDWRKDQPVVVVVDKEKRQTYVLQKQNDKAYIVFEADNAIGTSESPTPPGPYTVASKTLQPTWTPTKRIDPQQKTVGPYKDHKDNPLGVAAIRLNKWNIVLHGTNNPNSIGKTASAGCIRHRNEDIETLYRTIEKGDRVIVTDHLIGAQLNPAMFAHEDETKSKKAG